MIIIFKNPIQVASTNNFKSYWKRIMFSDWFLNMTDSWVNFLLRLAHIHIMLWQRTTWNRVDPVGSIMCTTYSCSPSKSNLLIYKIIWYYICLKLLFFIKKGKIQTVLKIPYCMQLISVQISLSNLYLTFLWWHHKDLWIFK